VNSIVRGFKTIRQVGLLPILQVGLYRFGLLIGHYRRISNSKRNSLPEKEICWLEPVQSFHKSEIPGFIRSQKDSKAACLNEAKLILNGKCRIFGHQIVDIIQVGLDTSYHWTELESGRAPLPAGDIKFVWEPARLGWLFALGRALAYDGNPKLGNQAWGLLEKFFKLNPVDFGPNWMSGQETALRILALVFFHEVFRNESDLPNGWEQTLADAVIAHAQRIPPTLVYAQSQQNNHLLVEAAGLYTAGVFLPSHPEAKKWRKTGWRIFHNALDTQIQDDGTYAQFSTNYHRLMLQIALWVKAVSFRGGDEFPESSSKKLAVATNWLKNLTDPQSGRVPNYGHNDGAYIFPLTGSSFNDFRPVVTACERLFENESSTEERNEMTLWFEWLAGTPSEFRENAYQSPPVGSYRKLVGENSSIVMFAPHYTHRPGQADVLQTEIWRDGTPILLDAGTYQYNADPPWQNALAQTKVHNTLTINGQNQMVQAGRFLWLDWPKVHWGGGPVTPDTITASHDGYRKQGVFHLRCISQVIKNKWQVFDEISPVKSGEEPQLEICLQWLLIPINWQVTEDGLKSDQENIQIRISCHADSGGRIMPAEYQIIKAGDLMYSSLDRNVPKEEITNLGWFSPTYGVKEPAVSYRIIIHGRPLITLQTEFQFG
jgi:hypothetical protein